MSEFDLLDPAMKAELDQMSLDERNTFIKSTRTVLLGRLLEIDTTYDNVYAQVVVALADMGIELSVNAIDSDAYYPVLSKFLQLPADQLDYLDKLAGDENGELANLLVTENDRLNPNNGSDYVLAAATIITDYNDNAYIRVYSYAGPDEHSLPNRVADTKETLLRRVQIVKDISEAVVKWAEGKGITLTETIFRPEYLSIYRRGVTLKQDDTTIYEAQCAYEDALDYEIEETDTFLDGAELDDAELTILMVQDQDPETDPLMVTTTVQ